MTQVATYSGGCQCGAVRFHFAGQLGPASICHCRMCQKAFGNFYAPLVSVDKAHLRWSRGEPKYFQSSNHVRRGFCGACGTPLTYDAPDGLALAIGAFDDPQAVVPEVQWGIENKLNYVDGLHALPAFPSEGDVETIAFVQSLISYQHPDHDTRQWPQHQS